MLMQKKHFCNIDITEVFLLAFIHNYCLEFLCRADYSVQLAVAPSSPPPQASLVLARLLSQRSEPLHHDDLQQYLGWTIAQLGSKVSWNLSPVSAFYFNNPLLPCLWGR